MDEIADLKDEINRLQLERADPELRKLLVAQLQFERAQQTELEKARILAAQAPPGKDFNHFVYSLLVISLLDTVSRAEFDRLQSELNTTKEKHQKDYDDLKETLFQFFGQGASLYAICFSLFTDTIDSS